MSLKRVDFVWQENSKPSVFTKLVIGRKNTKNILVSIEKGKEKLTLIVVF